MRHGVKKIQCKGGRDASRSIERKLLMAFLEHGMLEITISRAKALRQMIDTLTGKAIRGSQSDRNVLLRRLGRPGVVSYMITTVGPALKERKSGFVRISSTSVRMGDNARMGKVSWVTTVPTLKSQKDIKLKTTKEQKKLDKKTGRLASPKKVALKKTAKSTAKSKVGKKIVAKK